ncbi:D-arabinono-1,4-lactone oxidase [Hansschlegelia plantiphila]|uniref:FAD-dependent oxidoreductase n=1 Tax=Hansschlegelia plantiphila TaxID=374655 RepID=A0A9W6J3G7_9HYPH|nr:D-arabinono-1,4-lactone oxidase [Hansschlegelia plantiphila]GLK69637.1 FAD-dependent oxidoreductase [Hansschlegelia plantiphila]
MLSPDSGLLEPGRLWYNWFGEQYFVPTYTARPKSEEDVRTIVREARKLGLPLRGSGAGHSNPAIVPTPGVHVDFDAMREIVSVDKAKLQVTVQPGVRVGELSRYLRTQGMSLNNQGDIDTQAVPGAIMTATHGAGKTLPCMSAQMIAARIVTADGDFLDLSAEKDGELFKAFRASIGMFGLIVSLTIQAVPSYNIHKRSWNTDVEDTIGNLHQRLDDNRTFWFFWLPKKESADLYVLPGGAVPSTATRDHDICHMRTYNPVPVDEPAPELQPGEQFDHSSVIYPNPYIPNFREIEYAVPFGRFEEAFAEVRERMLQKYPEAIYPIECRAVKGDDSYLSAYAERDGYAMSISGPLEYWTWGMLKEMDEILDRYEARPHWGKHHFMSPARLERLYPRYDAFKKIRREIDPGGMFLNDHLRALFV